MARRDSQHFLKNIEAISLRLEIVNTQTPSAKYACFGVLSGADSRGLQIMMRRRASAIMAERYRESKKRIAQLLVLPQLNSVCHL
jgi:hypothetical protein